MAYTFSIPGRILGGPDALRDAVATMAGKGLKALVVTDDTMVRLGTLDRLTGELKAQGIDFAVYSGANTEPTDLIVNAGLDVYRRERCGFLIGMGGGSALDTMKAVGAMAANPGKLSDYMGKEIPNPIPWTIAIPTTAGTGSECTQFTIITDTQNDVKMLLKGRVLLPDVAVLAPEFSASAPPKITASTGLDALTHAIEAYTSRKAQPLTDTLALSAVKRIFSNLPKAFTDGSDMAAREQMAVAALEAGISFNNSSVTLVHGMSRPIGALFHVPHGISNAMLLGVCLDYAQSGAYERFATLGRAVDPALTALSDPEAAGAFIGKVRVLCDFCQVPTLEGYGIDRERFMANLDKMASDALQSGSPANTRRTPDHSDIVALYKALW